MLLVVYPGRLDQVVRQIDQCDLCPVAAAAQLHHSHPGRRTNIEFVARSFLAIPLPKMTGPTAVAVGTLGSRWRDDPSFLEDCQQIEDADVGHDLPPLKESRVIATIRAGYLRM